MKRKITGVCLALAVTLGMWCGAQTSRETRKAKTPEKRSGIMKMAWETTTPGKLL